MGTKSGEPADQQNATTYSFVKGRRTGRGGDASSQADEGDEDLPSDDGDTTEDAEDTEDEVAPDGDDDGSDDQPPKMAEVEILLARGDYKGVCELCGPPKRAAKLPPALAIVYATAHKEAGDDEESAEVNFLAIRSVATLLGVAEDSRTALMIAKRMLRRNPTQWGKRAAPRAPARVLLIVLGLTAGIVAGWLAGPGGVDLVEVIQTVFR